MQLLQANDKNAQLQDRVETMSSEKQSIIEKERKAHRVVEERVKAAEDLST